jgi:hypothetical protein
VLSRSQRHTPPRFKGKRAMRNPEYIIKIAADDISKLRRVDVFRVLENCSDEELNATAEHIKTKRPDLELEVSSSLSDISAERQISQ